MVAQVPDAGKMGEHLRLEKERPLELTADRRQVVAAWRRGEVMQSALPRSGAVNETILLTLTDGEYVLRGYRHRIDWDQTYGAPPAWEVLRTLHLNFAFAPAMSLPFLTAYQSEAPLTLDELDQTALLYWVMRQITEIAASGVNLGLIAV